jgi:hypothetical protein
MELASTEKTFYDRLKCTLTTEEILDLSAQMAQAYSRKVEHDKALKSITASIKSDIAKEDMIISNCSEKLNTGFEIRRVECKEVKDFENEKVLTYRLDVDPPLLFRERKMDPEERQKELPLDEEEKLETEGEIQGEEDQVEVMETI